MKTLKVKDKDFHLFKQSFMVSSTEKRTETQISGSGGGGFSYQGTGFTNVNPVTSRERIHDRLFLVDEEGNEHDIELQNWDIGCAPGHIITIVWSEEEPKKPFLKGMIWVEVKKFDSMGKYWAIKNENTRTTIYNEPLFKDLTRLPFALFSAVFTLLFYFIVVKWLLGVDSLWSLIPVFLFSIIVWQKLWLTKEYNKLYSEVKNFIGN